MTSGADAKPAANRNAHVARQQRFDSVIFVFCLSQSISGVRKSCTTRLVYRRDETRKVIAQCWRLSETGGNPSNDDSLLRVPRLDHWKWKVRSATKTRRQNRECAPGENSAPWLTASDANRAVHPASRSAALRRQTWIDRPRELPGNRKETPCLRTGRVLDWSPCQDPGQRL